MQQATAVELARADHIARMAAGLTQTTAIASSNRSDVAASSYGGLARELSRQATIPQNSAVPDVIHNESREELAKLEQGVLALHQAQDENDQTISHLARAMK